MGKKCNLCDGVARMYCESDQASLCWDCDRKVHGANFLVAKHTRCLLCSSCQSLTPWKASGLSLGPTFSVCDSCVALKNADRAGNSIVSENRVQEVNSFDDGAESYDDDEEKEEDDDEDEEEYSDDDEDEEECSDDDDDDDDDDEDEEEAENQVVPWSAATQQPPLMSISSSDGGSGSFVTKRIRDFSDDEIRSSSGYESTTSRPMKRPTINEASFNSTAVVNSVIRLNGAAESSSSLNFTISKTRRDLSR